jgi:hypothetical protein
MLLRPAILSRFSSDLTFVNGKHHQMHPAASVFYSTRVQALAVRIAARAEITFRLSAQW